MSVLVVGTMAFDAIETPFGKSDRIIGGAATYIALSASNFVTPIKQISVVGGDFPEEFKNQSELIRKSIDDKICRKHDITSKSKRIN